MTPRHLVAAALAMLCGWALPAAARHEPILTVAGEAKAFSPDGRLLLVTAEVRQHVYDLAAGRRVADVDGAWGLFSPDSRWLAVSTPHPTDRENRQTTVYARATWQAVGTLFGAPGSFSPDSRQIRSSPRIGFTEWAVIPADLPPLDADGRPTGKLVEHDGQPSPGRDMDAPTLTARSADGRFEARWFQETKQRDKTVVLDAASHRELGRVKGKLAGFAVGQLFTDAGAYALPDLAPIDHQGALWVAASADQSTCLLRRQPAGTVEIWRSPPARRVLVLAGRCPDGCAAQLFDRGNVLALGDGYAAALYDVASWRRLAALQQASRAVDDSAHGQFAVQTARDRWTVWRRRD